MCLNQPQLHLFLTVYVFGSATTTLYVFGSATTTLYVFGSATTTLYVFGSASTTQERCYQQLCKSSVKTATKGIFKIRENVSAASNVCKLFWNYLTSPAELLG